MSAVARPALEPPEYDCRAYRSAAYQEALLRLERFARDDTAPILIQGEPGTGKTLLARRIHELSPRARGPFQHLVLSTVDDGLAGSELFGHTVGAFTDARRPRAGHFASANGGTLFLDEIAKASRSLQGMLLHAMEYGSIRPLGSDREFSVNARVVAATNADLGELSTRDVFLPDLYARLATFRVTLPPLRERRADIPRLVAEAVRRHARTSGYEREPAIHADLMRALQRAPWPNNLRELDATVHRLMLEAEGAAEITLGHCTAELGHLADAGTAAGNLTAEQIDEAMKRAGTIVGAARLLGVDRKTLRLTRRRLGNPRT